MIPRTLTIHKYADPQNSYFKVPLGRIRDLNLIDRFSLFSYLGNGYAFLEEQTDYPVFEKALIDSGVVPNIVSHSSSKPSKCRSYKPYESEKVKRLLWIQNG